MFKVISSFSINIPPEFFSEKRFTLFVETFNDVYKKLRENILNIKTISEK